MADRSSRGLALYVRLSAMMFLQFAVWGAWSVVIAGHMEQNLGFDGKQISYIFGTTAFGAIISPLIAGWIADRWLPNQLVTGLMHLLGAALLAVAWSITPAVDVAAGQTGNFGLLWWVMLAYAMTYFPTIALTNAIAFHHMGNAEKFGNIRVWGTIGWIAVQTGLGAYLAYWSSRGAALGQAHMRDCLAIAATAAVAMGLYCLTLPHTPPTRQAKNPYAFLEAFSLTANRNFAVLLLISFIVAIELPFYYNLTYLFLTESAAQGGVGLEPGRAQLAMTLGQWGEMILMLALWPMIRRGGMRWTIFLGILAWPVRYAIFAIGQPAWLVIASQTLHGICYAFFFVGGMIAVERLAPHNLRASAQGLMVFATNGLGMLVGHFVSGRVHDYYRLADGGHRWANIFYVPIAVTVVAGIAFLLLFNERRFQEDAARVAAESAAAPPPAA